MYAARCDHNIENFPRISLTSSRASMFPPNSLPITPCNFRSWSWRYFYALGYNTLTLSCASHNSGVIIKVSGVVDSFYLINPPRMGVISVLKEETTMYFSLVLLILEACISSIWDSLEITVSTTTNLQVRYNIYEPLELTLWNMLLQERNTLVKDAEPPTSHEKIFPLCLCNHLHYFFYKISSSSWNLLSPTWLKLYWNIPPSIIFSLPNSFTNIGEI